MGRTRHSKKPVRPTYSAWNRDQIDSLVCLIIEFSYPPGWTGTGPATQRIDWDQLAEEHNSQFNLNRSPQSLSAMYRRLKECFTYASYTKAWTKMNEYQALFLPPERAKPEKVSELLDVVRKQQEQITQLMVLLDKKTMPAESHQKSAH